MAHTYATKLEVREVADRVDRVEKKVNSQETTLSVTVYRLDQIQNTLTKLTWGVLTPLLGVATVTLITLLTRGS